MQIAVPTLLILLGLIPGIAFLNSYYGGKFPRELASLSALGELVLYVIWALPINALAIWMAPTGFDEAVRVGLAALFHARPDASSELYDRLTAFGWVQVVLLYVGLVLTAGILGLLVRRMIWTARLDLKFPLFVRMKPDWYYVLQGRVKGLPRRVIPYADVLVSHPGGEGARLYAGVISDFEVTKGGDIKELVLVATQRHSGRGKKTTIRDIPGERFIVMGSTIHSINMRYSHLEPPTGAWERLRYRLNGLWRSFAFEEP